MSIIDLGQSLKSVNEKAVFNNNLNKVLKKKLKQVSKPSPDTIVNFKFPDVKMVMDILVILQQVTL